MPADYPVKVGEDRRKVADLVEHEKHSIRAGRDLSLPLIGLAYYVDEPTWQNDLGQEWSIEELVPHESRTREAATADGGTTRLLR